MNKLKVAVFALLAMFVFTGCSLKKSDNDLIKINNTVITKKEFDKAYESVTSNNMFAQMGIDLKEDTDNSIEYIKNYNVFSISKINDQLVLQTQILGGKDVTLYTSYEYEETGVDKIIQVIDFYGK